jgi:phosphoglycerate dehydrogenase-like enzyme
MGEHKVLFLTERSPRHQEDALNAAPTGLRVTMLRQPKEAVLLREIADAEFLVSERAGEIDGELLAAAPHLRLIQRLGSLIYDIDLGAGPTCTSDGLSVAGIGLCDGGRTYGDADVGLGKTFARGEPDRTSGG